MLFNEIEMLEVCKKYGIDVVEKEGYPLYNGDEMDENFSMDEIMRDTYNINISEKVIYSKTIELEMTISFEYNDFTNSFLNEVDKSCFVNVHNDECYKSVKSSMPNNNNISVAA